MRATTCTLLAVGLTIAMAVPEKPSERQLNDLSNCEVLIVRHAERDGILDKLTRRGHARADAYARYFDDLDIDGRTVHLTHLIAEKSKRTRETLLPLSRAAHLPLDTRFSTTEYGQLVADLKSHSYGNEILICWHHHNIPKLITAFGGNDAALLPGGRWPDGTYDWIIDLRFDAQGNVIPSEEKCLHEHLMPGDSTTAAVRG